MSFTIAIIPDTQILSFQHPEIFDKLARWIVDNREAQQIRMVLHLGDVVHHGASKEEEFRNAGSALARIDEAGIPMLIVPGNHDYDNMLRENRSLDMFNAYFGPARYAGKSWFGGTFEPGKAENAYATLDADGHKLLFVALEFGPRDEVLAWTDGLLERYADHKAIMITHCYMFLDGSRNKPGDAHNPKTYPGASGANDGEDMWNKCFRKHGNVIAIYSGHQIPDNISYNVDFGDRSNPVFQSFQNWQMGSQGGEGRIRLVHVNVADSTMEHRVVHPLQDAFEREDGYEVRFRYGAAVPGEADRREWAGLLYPPPGK